MNTIAPVWNFAIGVTVPDEPCDTDYTVLKWSNIKRFGSDAVVFP